MRLRCSTPMITLQMNNTSFLQTNNAYNLLLSHTSDDYNSPLLHTDDVYDSFMDTYFNNIMASEDILNDFGNQQISDNAFDDFDNEVDVEDEAKEMEHEVDFENEDKEMKHEVNFENKDKKIKPEPRYSLTVNQFFKTWKAVDDEIDKVDKEPRHRVYTCTKEQTYVPHKEAHILSERDRGHKSMVQNITIVEARYCQLTKKMQDDVRLLSSCGVQAGAIIEVLQKKYPKKHIYVHNVYNMIQAIHFENCVASDAGSTYLELIKKQYDKPGYYINAKFEEADNHLVGLMWMWPSQIQLWSSFHDVVLINTTFKMNRYSMMLCMLIIINNHNRSCLVATVVILDETSNTFSWIFEYLLEASNGLASKVLFMDADCAMVSAVNTTLPNTKHYFCLFHIRKNLENHVEITFEKCWADLLQKYPDSVLSFNAGVQTTQRVESYNGIIKKHINGSSSLFELTILKIQCRKMNLSIHYQAQLVNLTDRLQSQITDEISAGMFSDNQFDAFVIELKELISDLNYTRIHEIWKVSSINMKIAKFHVGNISHRWYLDEVICGEETKINNEPANSIINNEKFGLFIHSIQVNFMHLDSIRGSYVFTHKKTLDLAIATGWYEELCEMHLNLMKEMEIELVTEDNCNIGDDNIELFAASISNPVGIHLKGRKWKILKEARIGINENLTRQENCCSICDQARPNSCTCNSDVSNNQMNDVNKEGFNDVVNHSRHENKSRHCGVCGQIGHNARTCNLDSSSKQINNLVLEGHNRENEIRSPLSLPITSKNGEDLNLMSSVDKDLANNKSRRCGTCGQVGHNARTCDVKR
ncbi:6653_t:CDS:10 [Cetraspora pellucida]|uniref:6653_t:CDS:1 n=1 Tax=Cetraspora pellucida TaxID=1433469 RepID=A0A9N9A059_9GLOM|nr:6653_t:CDS:10 [Cetraspora pellucida]